MLRLVRLRLLRLRLALASAARAAHGDALVFGRQRDLERLVVVEREGTRAVLEAGARDREGPGPGRARPPDVDGRGAEALAAEVDLGARRLRRDLELHF